MALSFVDGVLAVAVGLACLGVFRQCWATERVFVEWDDLDNFLFPPNLQPPFSWSKVRWCLLQARVLGVWEPLASLFKLLLNSARGVSDASTHVTASVVLHTATTVTALVASRDCQRRLQPNTHSATWASLNTAAAALFFAVHPLRVQVVAWASGQPMTLAALMSVVACWVHCRLAIANHPVRCSLLSMFFYACAAAFKTTALPLVAVLGCVDLWVRWSRNAPTRFGEALRSAFASALVCAPHVGVALFVASHAFSAQERQDTSVQVAAPYLGPLSVLWYPVHTLFPGTLALTYTFRPTTPHVVQAAAGAGLTVASVVTLLWACRKPRVRSAPLWGCLVFLCYVVLILPTMGLVRHGNSGAVADRYSYLPSLLLIPAIPVLLQALCSRFRLHPSFPLAVLLALSASHAARTVELQSHWGDSVRLFRFATQSNPEDVVSWNNLARALEKTGGAGAEIERCYRAALDVSPGYFTAHYNLGRLLAQTDRHEEALRHLRLVEAGGYENKPDVHLTMGVAHKRLGNVEQAERHYKRAIALAPNSPHGWRNLANLYIEGHRMDEAVRAVETELRIDPQRAQLFASANSPELARVGKRFARGS